MTAGKNRKGRLRLVQDEKPKAPREIWLLAGGTAGLALAALFKNRFLGALAGGCAMFAAGRLLRAGQQSAISRSEGDAGAPAKQEQKQLNKQLFVNAGPQQTYQMARQLHYFDADGSALDPVESGADGRAMYFDVTEDAKNWRVSVDVTADQLDEFFAVRVEHGGQLLGTGLITFDVAPGATGTVVSVTCRPKHVAWQTAAVKTLFEPIINREIERYLADLKQRSESRVLATQGQPHSLSE